jgi:outer membrane protein assembly factor BamB
VDRAIDVPGGRTIVDVAPADAGDSTLVALDRASGKVLWRHRLPYRNGPWGLDGNVLVTGINGQTAGIDVRTGKQLWLADVNAVSGEQAPPILVHNHVAYLIGGPYGLMTALDIRTQRVLWRQTLAGTVLVTPVVTNQSIVAAVSPLPLGTGGWIKFLDPVTGSEQPSRVGIGGFIGLTDWSAGHVIVATAEEFSNASQGPPLSGSPSQCCYQVRAYPDRSVSTPLDGVPARPLVMSDALVVATSSGTVTGYRADATSEWGGVFAWTASVGPSEQPDVTAAAGEAVVAGGSLTALRPTDGTTAWTAPVRDAYFPAPAAGDVVVATSRTDGTLYVVDGRAGRIVKAVRDGTAQTEVTVQRDAMVTASEQGVVTGYRITRR